MAVIDQLRRGVEAIAGAVARTQSPAVSLWGEWATVDDASLATVVLDSDWQRTPRPVQSNAAGHVEDGQRVWVAHQGPLLIIVANPSNNLPPNSVRIDGTDYAREGSWASETLGTPDYTAGSINNWTLNKTAPYLPPDGWTFEPWQISTNGFLVVGGGGFSGSTVVVRVMGVSSGPTLRLGWRLAKV